jgi:hypothetical protein
MNRRAAPAARRIPEDTCLMLAKPGNILGTSRAEADTFMLERAFIETADFASLTKTRDFNFVVGRRGTGKSALFKKVSQYFSSKREILSLAEGPEEHEAAAFQSSLSHFGADYGQLRLLSRLAWKLHLLIETAVLLLNHYKTKSGNTSAFLRDYLRNHAPLVARSGMLRCAALLDGFRGTEVRAAAAALASAFSIDDLKKSVQANLHEVGLNVVLLFDGLDEGWAPDILPTSIIGGLAKAVSEIVESDLGIYPVVFIRDNMSRALAELDNDFTRNVEGNSIRLHWDESSLLHLVAARLRVALNLEYESDIKVWNRFAHKGLEGRDGFRLALQQTLYRPRDILTLLNDAYQLASRQGRSDIIASDVEAGSARISQSRLDDLIKEYDTVFPGLKHFVRIFSSASAFQKVGVTLELLAEALSSVTYDRAGAADFALFDAPEDIFFSLYSVGFLGVSTALDGVFTFCHDGSLASPSDITSSMFAAVHPCYWRVLNINPPADAEPVLLTINDEYDERPAPELGDFRTARLGQVADELPRTPRGAEGAAAFEKWVLRAVTLVFDGTLSNPELKPNPGATQQRDVVATNLAERGFWKRIYDSYGARQVLFECKNYEELTTDDFRQVLSYMTGEYGKFAIVVLRSDKEIFSPREEDWIRELYYKHGGLIVMPLPAEQLSRAIRKLRNPNRKVSYAEDLLGKRMDHIVRRVLNIPQTPRYRGKKR